MLLFTGNLDNGIISCDGSYTQVRNHSGRTVAPEGFHNDFENASGLGTVHYHHGVSHHLHPMGACPYKKADTSLIDLFRSYQAVVFTATKVVDGYTKYVFEAIITLESDKKYFTLEITSGHDEGFYLASGTEKILKEKFRGTGLAVERVSRDGSPWIGVQGGLDYMVNAEYFKNMIKKYCGLDYVQPKPAERYQVHYILDPDGNLKSYGNVSRYPLKYIDFIKAYETHDKDGDIHILSNGGRTIAYGHDVSEGEDFSAGLNEYEAINLLLSDLDWKYNNIVDYVDTLNSDYGYNINLDDFSENELLFLNDFGFNRGAGYVVREDLMADGKPYNSWPILIAVVALKDDATIIKTLQEETLSADTGEYYPGLELRRMDEYEILKRGDFVRDYDIERGYR